MSELEVAFPGLRTTPFWITSPHEERYNCIAWAGGDTEDQWWPTDKPARFFWPPTAPREVSLSAFAALFVGLGYTSGADASLEEGFEKVALFTDAHGAPTHAARQLRSGRWTSKLGLAVDIEHELLALEGDIYGKVAMLLKRPSPAR